MRPARALPSSLRPDDGKRAEDVTDPRQLADMSCAFFTTRGDREPPSSQRERDQELLDLKDISEAPDGTNTGAHASMSDCITDDELQAALARLRRAAAPGPDSLQPWMLLDGGEVVRGAILRLFNLSWRAGYVPIHWRQATIVPIPKTRRAPKVAGDLRPVSLLSVLGKLLDRIVYSRLSALAESRMWIDYFQYGFRPSRSTTDMLVMLQQLIHTSWADGKVYLAVKLDLSGAFDTVWHDGLVATLEGLGVRSNMLRWLKSFLSDRRSRVRWRTTLSQWHDVRTGVPQGSPLSPLLFILYATRVLGLNDGVNPAMFADDITVSCSGLTASDAARKLNRALRIIEARCKLRRLKIGTGNGKSKAVLFTRSTRRIQPPVIIAAGERLPIEKSMKIVGVRFDRGLRWITHIDDICKKVRQRLGLLCSTCGHTWGVNTDTFVWLYKSYILPVLEYCAPVWGDASLSQLRRLDPLQHLALARALGVYRPVATIAAQAELGVPPLRLRREALLIRYDARVRLLPGHPIRHLFHKLTVRPSHRLRNATPSSVYERLAQLRIAEALPVDVDSIQRRLLRKWNNEWQASAAHSSVEYHLLRPSLPPPRHAIKRAHLRRTSWPRPELSIWHGLRMRASTLAHHLWYANLRLYSSCACGPHVETSAHFLIGCRLHSASRVPVLMTLHRWQLPPTLPVLLDGDTITLDAPARESIDESVRTFVAASRRFEDT